MAIYPDYGNERGNPGVQALVLPQDTTEAARLAITPQEPGSEFHPAPHPDYPRLIARLKELDKECTTICDKLYMGPVLDYAAREELQDKMQECDNERAQIRGLLNSVYEGIEGPESNSDDAKGPYTNPEVKVISPDATASMA